MEANKHLKTKGAYLVKPIYLHKTFIMLCQYCQFYDSYIPNFLQQQWNVEVGLPLGTRITVAIFGETLC